MSFIFVNTDIHTDNYEYESSSSFSRHIPKDNSKYIFYIEFDIFDYNKLEKHFTEVIFKDHKIFSINLNIHTEDEKYGSIVFTKDALLYAKHKKFETLFFTICFEMPKSKENKTSSWF